MTDYTTQKMLQGKVNWLERMRGKKMGHEPWLAPFTETVDGI